MSVRKKCECGCEIVFETDMKPPRKHECFMCGASVAISKEEDDVSQDLSDVVVEAEGEETIIEPVKKKRGRPAKVK